MTDAQSISIHALLAESDMLLRDVSGRSVISIHALLAESDDVNNPVFAVTSISIHALLAESDANNQPGQRKQHDFYPRSPCGERP